MRKDQVDPFLISNAELSTPSKAFVFKNRDECLKFALPDDVKMMF